MILGFHGGGCCGIKVIYDLGYNPNMDVFSPLEKIPENNSDADTRHLADPEERFFTDAAPAEKARERFARYVKYCEYRRPSGIIEVVLQDSPEKYWNQVLKWGPILEKHGFKEVNRCMNSNSGNTIHVYHKNCGE